MRYGLLVPAVILFWACNNPRAKATKASDSAEVTELAPETGGARAAKPDTAFASSGVNSLTTIDAGLAARGGKKNAAPDTTEEQFRANVRCGIKGDPVLTRLGIGNLEIGRTIAVVKQTCRVLRDLQEDNEGETQRVLTVMVADEPVRVTVVDGLVWRIALRSPRFSTRDGMRVGTTLARVANKGGVHLSEGEDGLYMTVDSHCGLNFRFSIPSRETPGKPWTLSHVVARHGSAQVDRIVVTRCEG